MVLEKVSTDESENDKVPMQVVFNQIADTKVRSCSLTCNGDLQVAALLVLSGSALQNRNLLTLERKTVVTAKRCSN